MDGGLPASVHLLGLSEAAFVSARGGRGRREGGRDERVLTLQLQHLGGGGAEEKEEEVVIDPERLLARWGREGWRVGRVEGRTLTGLYGEESLQAKGRKGCAVRWEEEGEGRGAHMTLWPRGFCTLEVGMVKEEEEEGEEEEVGVVVAAVARKERGNGG